MIRGSRMGGILRLKRLCCCGQKEMDGLGVLLSSASSQHGLELLRLDLCDTVEIGILSGQHNT